MSAPKILFIMQRVSPGTHMDYVFEMARTLKEDKGLPLTLLVEKPSPNLKPADWIQVQRWQSPLLRVVENFWCILRARLRGTKVFYVHYSFLSSISAGIITRILGGKVYYWNAGMPWLYERSWIEDTYQKIAYRLIHVLVTGAEALRAGYTQTYGLRPESIVVIPNWIDLAACVKEPQARKNVRARYGIPDTAPMLLFVQKQAKRKGAHLMPAIFEQVTNRDAHLIMAGDGPLRQSLEADFTDRGLMDRVHMVGSLDREAIQALYQAADVYVLPSEEEGSPHALIEALAYGLPAVVSDAGGVPETMTEQLQDWVLPYGKTEAFARKIDLLLGDDLLRGNVSRQSREIARRYEKAVIVEKYYSLFV